MNIPVADLHCDLLYYLMCSNNRTAYDEKARCAIPQLRQGNVFIQTLAIFGETRPGSSELGVKQAKLFQELPVTYPEDFYIPASLEEPDADKIGIIAAIENASVFMEEDEPFQKGMERFNRIRRLVKRIAYVSLTWNTENRFGGGAHTSIGLKEDGKRLLDLLAAHQIPFDISHTSDRLAEEAFEHIDKNRLNIPVIASHSNMRAVANMPRNLPDALVKEVISRKGIIGFNFYQPFIGLDKQENILLHFAHLIELGGLGNCVFGGDFFNGEDFSHTSSAPLGKHFFPQFGNTGCYPYVLGLLKSKLNLSDREINGIAHQNFVDFMGVV